MVIRVMILYMLRIVGRVFSGSYRDSAFIVVKDGYLAIELVLGWCLTLIIIFFQNDMHKPSLVDIDETFEEYSVDISDTFEDYPGVLWLGPLFVRLEIVRLLMMLLKTLVGAWRLFRIFLVRRSMLCAFEWKAACAGLGLEDICVDARMLVFTC